MMGAGDKERGNWALEVGKRTERIEWGGHREKKIEIWPSSPFSLKTCSINFQ